MKIYNADLTMMLEEKNVDANIGRFDEKEIVVGQRDCIIEQTINEDGSISCLSYPRQEITERVQIFIPFTERETLVNEMSNLEKWFGTDYRKQFEKCTRKKSIDILLNCGANPSEKLAELYAEAESKSARINEIKALLKALD